MNGTTGRAKQPTTMSLKLLIDAPGKRVVFAEAGKDFVDFLFCILSQPVANVIGLVGKDATALGSVANLHGSTENLKSYLLPTAAKLLKPVANLSFLSPPPEKPKCTRCSESNPNPNLWYTSEDWPTTCAVCTVLQTDSKKRTAGGGGGFVKDLVAYMVMDDLTVMPLSTASTINVMNKLNVKRLAALEERVVNFTTNEANNFLKASLESKSVLTDFFLKDKCTKSNGPPQTVKKEVPTSEEDDNTVRSRVKRERII